MHIATLLPLALVLGALPSAAEIYRCADAQGRIHFTGDPSRCAGAQAYEPKAELVPAAPAPEGPTRRAPEGGARDLEALLLDASDLGPGWEITRELPQASADLDAAQRSMGIVEIQARHYGRTRSGVTETCTIELWRFADAERARAAEAVRPEGWHYRADGAVAITLRGTRFQRGKPFVKGVFPACEGLGARIAK